MKPSIRIDERGFTLVELFIGMVIVSMILLIGFGFFTFYGKTAAQSFKKSAGHESAAMALKLIQRDLAGAQNGLCPQGCAPELAVLATDQNNRNDGFYHELFINYARFLRPEWTPGAVPNVFTSSGYLRNAQVPGGQFVINAQNSVEQQSNIANIGYALVAADPFLGVVTQTLVNRVPGGAGTFPAQFTLVNAGGLPGNFRLAPAVGYMVNPVADPAANTNYGVLRRFGQNPDQNGVNIGQAILGGDFAQAADGSVLQRPTITVTDFRIRCLFVDNDGVTLRWTPTEVAFNAMTPANLRYVEITINYRTFERTDATVTGDPTDPNARAYGASVAATKTMRVGPRMAVLDTLAE